MAFPRQPPIVPAGIREVRVVLTDRSAWGDPGDPEVGYEPAYKAARYVAVVEMDNADTRELSGDLIPYLTQAQIAALLDFMADLRVKAEREILGETNG